MLNNMVKGKKNILVVAPHPDDETLGCGGTLLKLKQQGHHLHWLIITNMSTDYGMSEQMVAKRNQEILAVAKSYQFDSVHNLSFPPAEVDQLPTKNLVGEISHVFQTIKPDTIYLPFINDVHSDHCHVAKACLSCCKWFRNPCVKKVLYYETISETDHNFNGIDKVFTPNVYSDITDFFADKLTLANLYASEMGTFPFPRSNESISALATLRGSQCGYEKAEAFMLLKSID